MSPIETPVPAAAEASTNESGAAAVRITEDEEQKLIDFSKNSDKVSEVNSHVSTTIGEVVFLDRR